MTPKQRFLLTSDAETHRKMAHTELFTSALAHALLQLLEELPKPKTEGMEDDGLRAAANQYRIEGAVKFRDLIQTIGDKPMEQARNIPGQIDHRLK